MWILWIKDMLLWNECFLFNLDGWIKWFVSGIYADLLHLLKWLGCIIKMLYCQVCTQSVGRLMIPPIDVVWSIWYRLGHIYIPTSTKNNHLDHLQNIHKKYIDINILTLNSCIWSKSFIVSDFFILLKNYIMYTHIIVLISHNPCGYTWIQEKKNK